MGRMVKKNSDGVVFNAGFFCALGAIGAPLLSGNAAETALGAIGMDLKQPKDKLRQEIIDRGGSEFDADQIILALGI